MTTMDMEGNILSTLMKKKHHAQELDQRTISKTEYQDTDLLFQRILRCLAY